MRTRKLAVFGLAIATILATSTPAVAEPETPEPQTAPPDIAVVAVPGATSLVSAQQILRTQAGSDDFQAQWTAAQQLRKSSVKGTILDEPEPTTVDEVLALAKKAAKLGSAMEPSSTNGMSTQADGKSYISFDECAGKGQANEPNGWFKSHWAWCQSTPYVMARIIKGIVVGNAFFRATLIGRGYSGTRRTEVDVHITEVAFVGSWPGGADLRVAMECRGVPAAKHCKRSGGRTLWLKNNSTAVVPFKMSSTADDSKGSAKISSGIFTAKYIATAGSPVGTATSYTNGFRCDSASYLGSKGACVFDRHPSTFTMNRKDKDTEFAAKHVYDALHNPSKTYPGKGAPDTLTRMRDAKKVAANTAAAHKACKKKWPKKPAGKDCDEYPFKTTKEGAAYGNGRFSVRYVKSEHNQQAGRDYGAWLTSERILDGEKFHVKVK